MRERMPLLDESLQCPVCHHAFALKGASVRNYPAEGISSDMLKLKPDVIYDCPSCQVGISYPVLSDEKINSIYEKGDYWCSYKIQEIEPKKNPGQFVMASTRWNFVKEAAAMGVRDRELSILDIGGGHGFFGVAALMDKPGVSRLCIVEKDVFMQDSLKFTWSKNYPQTIFNVVDSLENVTGKFDIIVLSHILEHLNDPCGMIAYACRFLEKDGVVLIDVPHEDYVFKKNVFPHVLFYQPRSLSVACEVAGLKVVSVNTFGRDRLGKTHKPSVENKIMRMIERSFFKCSRFLPLSFSSSFYQWYFKPTKGNPDGVWVRLLAVKKN